MNEYQRKWAASRGEDPDTKYGRMLAEMAPTSPEDGAERQNRGSAWQAEGIVDFLLEGKNDAAKSNLESYLNGSGLGRSTVTKLIALDVVDDFDGNYGDITVDNLKRAKTELRKIQGLEE